MVVTWIYCSANCMSPECKVGVGLPLSMLGFGISTRDPTADNISFCKL